MHGNLTLCTGGSCFSVQYTLEVETEDKVDGSKLIRMDGITLTCVSQGTTLVVSDTSVSNVKLVADAATSQPLLSAAALRTAQQPAVIAISNCSSIVLRDSMFQNMVLATSTPGGTHAALYIPNSIAAELTAKNSTSSTAASESVAVSISILNSKFINIGADVGSKMVGATVALLVEQELVHLAIMESVFKNIRGTAVHVAGCYSEGLASSTIASTSVPGGSGQDTIGIDLDSVEALGNAALGGDGHSGSGAFLQATRCAVRMHQCSVSANQASHDGGAILLRDGVLEAKGTGQW